MKTGSASEKLLERRATAVEDRLVTIKEVAVRLGVCTRQIQKLRASGRFPSPTKISRSVRWKESVISEFIAADCNMGEFNARRGGGA